MNPPTTQQGEFAQQFQNFFLLLSTFFVKAWPKASISLENLFWRIYSLASSMGKVTDIKNTIN